MDKYIELYKTAFEGREYDSKRLWNLFNFLLIINGGLLTAIVTLKEPFKEIMILLAIIINLLWSKLLLRMIKWIEWWENKLKEIERILDIKVSLFKNRKLNEDVGISTRKLAYIIPSLFACIWFLYFVFSFKSIFSF